MFSGNSTCPYREDDGPRPLSVYGETKLEGEQFLLATGANAIILRMIRVYGVRGSNFLLTMLQLFDEREELRIVDDQVGAPIWRRMLAEATAHILYRLYRLLRGDLDPERVRGIYHATNGGATSWFDFVRTILALSGRHCRLLPIPTREYPAPARRPAYSVLDNPKLRETFGLALPDWDVSLRQCLEDLGCCKFDRFPDKALYGFQTGRIFCANSPSQQAKGASYNFLLLRKDCLFCRQSECYGPLSPSISLESIKSPG